MVADLASLSGIASAGTTKYESFRADGFVESADTSPETPLKEEFRLAAPVNTYGNVNLEAAKNPDGTLDIRPQATTRYYRYDTLRGRYVKGVYEDTVVVGFEVRVGGKYGRVNGEYEVLADTVWQPPVEIQPMPPNPVCATVKDYSFGRRYAAAGEVTQTGWKLSNLGLYSDFWGFVLGNLTMTNNAHVAAVAAHDHNRLGINTVLTGEQNTVTGFKVPFTTRYRKQDPDTLKWHESTKDEVVQSGALVRSGGRYGCEFNDWRFVAQFVWNPVPGATTGNVQFQEVTQRTDEGTTGPGSHDDTAYNGTIITGDETVGAGGAFALDNVDWIFNTVDGVWDFDGEWVFTNAQGHGTVLGNMGGSWDPDTSNIVGTAIMSGGTGRYSGYVGMGSISGTGLAPLTGGTPTTFDGKWIISVM